MRNRREDFMVWGASLGIHAVLLLLLSLTGIFSMAAHEPKDLTEVALYDVSGGDEGGGGGSQGEASPEPAAPEVETSVDEVAIPEENVPAVEKKKEQQGPAPQTAAGTAGEKNNGAGSGSGSGSGNGNGSGTGDGSGSGSGSGHGGGSGGTANPDALTPELPPKITYRAQPEYPASLRKKNATGTVGISFVVGADGSVTSASVDSSSGYPEMDAAALAAVYEYTFSPALNSSGRPVACGSHTNIHFAVR